LRRLRARRSPSDFPPHTPVAWPVSVAHFRQASATSHRRQTALASSVWTSAGAVFPSGNATVAVALPPFRGHGLVGPGDLQGPQVPRDHQELPARTQRLRLPSLAASGTGSSGHAVVQRLLRARQGGFHRRQSTWSGSGKAGGHEVEAVGVEIDTKDAFNSVVIYANSWGTGGGDSGYFRMRLRTYEQLPEWTSNRCRPDSKLQGCSWSPSRPGGEVGL
jgi:Papain family cysteine protease